MIHSENGKISWEGDSITLGAELTQLLVDFRREEPEIFLAVLMAAVEKGSKKK